MIYLKEFNNGLYQLMVYMKFRLMVHHIISIIKVKDMVLKLPHSFI